MTLPQWLYGRRTGALRTRSLSSSFLLFAVAILGGVVLLAAGFWVQVYRDELNKKQLQLAQEASRVDITLSDSMDYITHYTRFIGERIAQGSNSRDLEFISLLVGGRLDPRPGTHDLYFTTTFDWVTPDKRLRASSNGGILPTPYDMSTRDYLFRTEKQPWTLQISDPRVGGISQQWIVPAGMGVTDAQGKFLGSVTLGFGLDGLVRRISQMVGPSEVHYLVLTRGLKLVLDSRADNSAGPNAAFLPVGLEDEALQGSAGKLAQPYNYNGTDYTYYRKLEKYPYIVLTGYRQGMALALFNQTVLSRLVGLAGIAGAAFLMLFFMRRRLVQPVVELARKAERIREGKVSAKTISSVNEICLLDAELDKISHYLTARRRAQAELERVNEEALAARDAAIRADRAKSEFLANMSHELRTPMNAVVGLTHILLAREHAPDRRREYLQTMQFSAQQLMQLIDDLLDISKLENNQTSLESIAFRLDDTARDIVGMFTHKAEEKGISLRFEMSGDKPVEVLGDPLRLRQTLMNLVGNAIKFTSAGEVRVRLHCKRHAESMHVEFRVEDTGIGIPDDKQDAIFSKFLQADTSITRKFGGTGLGLSISKSLIELMGGVITVESEPGKGSVFIINVNFPLAQAAAPQETTAAAHGKRALLVEDNEGNVLVAKLMMESLGYACTIAHDGKEALKIFKSSTFDVVLMDVEMPEMDGLTVTRRLREIEAGRGRRVPIIAVTACALPSDRLRCLEAGMDDYLAKPFDVGQLEEALERQFRAKAA